MKQKDIALIIIVIFVSVLISYFISGKIIVPPKNRQQEVEVTQAISDQFNLPDKKYFNNSSINPTQIIIIGDNSNPDPFSKPTR